MNEEQTDDTYIQQVKKIHEGSFLNLVNIIGIKTLLSPSKGPLPLSILIAALFSLFTWNNENETIYELINQINDTSLTIIPSLLGFTLAGLTIIIGFGNSEYLKSLIKLKVKDNRVTPTLFQTIMAVFTWGILIQSITLCISIFYYIIIKLKIPISANYIKLESIFLINQFALFILNTFLIYSIFLIPKTILNVFRFGQGNHLNLFISNEKDKKSTPI